ncbi:neutral zinc metallopeptidase [Nocardiopsis ansamitocini]|uniref:Peptidase n=1 Tax=Nocardiopsis ansamitocini TaxID=1670832 RepID=A0A9W6P594_9ACTN|nr:neutral zinc metallopeptidase [Nocardiopsis ansamitocini]GLU47396.1 peptidase [Nocardiopsis ansamitocini]
MNGDGREPGADASLPPARWAALCFALGAVALALGILVWNAATPAVEEPAPTAQGDRHAVPGVETSAEADSRSGLYQGRPTGETALLDNPLYTTGRLAPLPCPAPELDVTDQVSMGEFLHTVSDCLDQAWAAQFAKAGIHFDPPSRVFWDEPGTSPCREYPSSAGAFYCRASKSVYIGTADIVEKWNGTTDSVVYASLLAHEYGHHVQGESGLLEYYHERRGLEPDPAEQSGWTRKGELQANCLAGAFLGAIQVTYPLTGGDRDLLLADAAATADREGSTDEERTHGSPANSVLWMEHGMEHQDPGACNTWVADDEVLQ